MMKCSIVALQRNLIGVCLPKYGIITDVRFSRTPPYRIVVIFNYAYDGFHIDNAYLNALIKTKLKELGKIK